MAYSAVNSYNKSDLNVKGRKLNLQTLRLFLSERPSLATLFSAGRHLFLADSRTREKRGIGYGGEERQQLDIYEPNEIPEDPDMIVFFYGGGWITGNKDIHRFLGRSWASKGYIVALPNYRLAPGVRYPDQMGDVARSLKWIRNNYENYPGKIYLAGHSAGAHLASLVGFSKKWREAAGLTLQEINGFILLAGVYQFYPYEKADYRVREFLGEEKYWVEAQPFNQVDDSLPPVFLAHGEEDTEVLPEQSIQMRDELEDLGIKSELLLASRRGHIELLLDTTRKETQFWTSLENFFGI